MSSRQGTAARTRSCALLPSLERGSEHPLGEAIVKGAEQRSPFTRCHPELRRIPGHGVSGNVDGWDVLLAMPS